MKYSNSIQWLDRSKNSLVGGVNSPVRAFKKVGGQAVLASHAQGHKIWDIDENEYIDFIMSFGPHLFGHAFEPVVESVCRAMKRSSCYGVSTKEEIQWAEMLLKFFPYAQKVRAVSSGTEACATAIRLARGYTQRSLVLKFSGHYHGHVDSLMVDAGSGLATLSSEAVADSEGVPSELAQLSRVVEFNDEAALEEVFLRYGDLLAAVIVEPIMGNMGLIPPKAGFLQKLRTLCDQKGAVLIFDEVMTGLRVHKYSAQGLYDIKPDLSTVGKIVGGGLAMAALLGKNEIMSYLAPEGPVYQAGTLSGNPISTAAGIAMLNAIDKADPYDALEKTSGELEEIFVSKAKVEGVRVSVQRVASMMSVFFRSESVANASHAREQDMGAFNCFFHALLEEGIMIPPSPFEAFFISTEHAKMDKMAFAEKTGKVFKKVHKFQCEA